MRTFSSQNFSSMGVSGGSTLGDCRKSVIVSILLFGVISSMLKPSSSIEVEQHDLDSRAGGSSVGPVRCPKKWIVKSYFEDFEALVDSHFHNFKEKKLEPCLCEALPGSQTTELKLSGLERSLIGEGSHRRLSSSIRLKLDEKPRATPHGRSCEVIVIERLPSGIFADPFELQHLHQRGVFGDVAVFGDTDLEVPTVRSNRTVVEIHMDVGPSSLSRQDELEINVDIPLHVRYPPLDESGYVRVVFGEPNVFARCNVDGRPLDQTCLSTMMQDTAEPIRSSVVWEVPSGIEQHAKIVSAVTFLTATLSAMAIVLASIFYSDAKSCKNLKQS